MPMRKRGISPVIATVLLIVLVIIIALIIFLWARGLVKEKITKFGTAIELVCQQTSLSAQYSGGKVIITNEGDVPVYGVAVKKQKRGKTETKEELVSLGPGESKKITITEVGGYENLLIVPILLGKSEKGSNKKYTCPDSTGVRVELQQ